MDNVERHEFLFLGLLISVIMAAIFWHGVSRPTSDELARTPDRPVANDNAAEPANAAPYAYTGGIAWAPNPVGENVLPPQAYVPGGMAI